MPVLSSFLATAVLIGENFRLYTSRWKEEVRGNTDTQIDNIYHASRRGIMVRESLVRALPTDDPLFNDPRQAGEGYPFDNLQMSSLRPGTPVYTLTKSKDQRWQYVVSPAVTGWVHSEDIASTDQKFITHWVLLAHKQLGHLSTRRFLSMSQASIISPGDRALFYRSDINGRASS